MCHRLTRDNIFHRR